MTDIVPLETEIRRRIAGGGPMAVAQYMELCLTDPERGYYARHDPFGTGGDCGLACRLYSTADGVQGAPSVDQFVEALRR